MTGIDDGYEPVGPRRLRPLEGHSEVARAAEVLLVIAGPGRADDRWLEADAVGRVRARRDVGRVMPSDHGPRAAGAIQGVAGAGRCPLFSAPRIARWPRWNHAEIRARMRRRQGRIANPSYAADVHPVHPRAKPACPSCTLAIQSALVPSEPDLMVVQPDRAWVASLHRTDNKPANRRGTTSRSG